MIFVSDKAEEVVIAIMDRYMPPPPETEPLRIRLAYEAERYRIYSKLLDTPRSLEDLISELSHIPF